ncbi:methyltransferase domain-containing protein [Paenibacillus silvae]|uniref:methyltransferase domain-containing protein n=1 Tax=Paenibacillus silvae TaxID=1325358 RepID=UPI0011A7C7DB|nr:MULTISPECIES: methyltransferase domain-containing protein [Paenibacillus]MCK6073872.1 methyltransferase domain-containing protein [Paenibacillus silvae]MCK6148652.1 methyltransferase domain-containing protein [Paenibacillus silvae]MCK6266952.1 methyltransferase domain-containing protein [Paenibacillus silvae]
MSDLRSTYNIQTAVLSFQEELERLKVQAIMGWPKEFRNLEWYGLKNGMRLLEVGSGPGYITEQLLNNLPDSEITSLEIDHTLQAQAKERLKDVSSERLKFVESSIYQIDLPDESFDFVVARLIFLHLNNPVEAAQEIYRVLKPGGRLSIIDVDDGVFGAVNPDIPALHTVLMKIADYVAQHGGNRLIGRSLPRLLSESGYINIDIDSVLQHSDVLGIEGFKQQFNLQRFVHFVEKGVISSDEFAQLQRASEAINHSPEAYAMMNFITACGTKPL